MVSNKRYEEQANFYDQELERIEKDRDYWRKKYYDVLIDCTKRTGEADIYKSILVKQGILDEPRRYSDELFMFEGKIYRPISFSLTMEPERNAELTVDFIRVREEE